MTEELHLFNQPYDFSCTLCEVKPAAKEKVVLQTSLGKRKYCQSFEQSTFEDDRYQQHIDNKFFSTNVGHLVNQNKIE